MIRDNLPEAFVRKMIGLLGEEEFEQYAGTLERPAYKGLRVNTSKVSPGDFFRMASGEGISLSPVEWTEDGFYLEDGNQASRHPWYAAGLYYLQEPSAMAPAAILPVSPGDKVLDLCAAPGGKSTELASRLCGQGFLLANDISVSRGQALLRNLEKQGFGNILVSAESPEKLAGHFPGYFDAILVDAPCSGEGMFHRDAEVLKSYESRGPLYYVPIQRGILRAAASMLAPGGYLLYSTCTFDEEENEGNVRALLSEFPELKPVPFSLPDGFLPGFGLPGSARLFPQRIKGEGHFLSLLRKEGGEGRREEVSGEREKTEKKENGKKEVTAL